jgi:hypothetical protein
MALFSWRGFIPGWKALITDFPNYYLTARLRLEKHELSRAYEWAWFQRQKDHAGLDVALVGFMPNPPFCAVPMLALARLSALTAKRVWLILNLLLLAASVRLLLSVTEEFTLRRILLLTFLCIVPLRSNFLCGQYYVVLLFLICLAYWSERRGHRFASGALIAVAAALKFFPAIFLLLFLWKRQWRAVAGFIAGGAVALIVSVACFGWDIHHVLLVEVLPRALRGDIIDPYSLHWNSLAALWHRLFLYEPQLNPHPWFDSAPLYAAIQSATALAFLFSFFSRIPRRQESESVAFEWASFVPLMLLLSSMPSSYHYCILIFSSVVGVDFLLSRNQKFRALLFEMSLVVAFLPTKPLYQLRLAGTLAAYAILLSFKLDHSERRRSGLWFGAWAVALTGLAVAAYLPLKGRGEDFAFRIQGASQGYSEFDPAINAGELAFVAMRGEGYELFTLTSPVPLTHSADVLSVAAGPNANAEVEDVSRHSSIVEVHFTAPNSEPVPITDGQQPAVSADGHWLTFTRDDNGIERLWIRSLWVDSSPTQVTHGARSVLESSVSDNGQIYAAIGPANAPEITTVSPTGQIAPLLPASTRYPAISPDAKYLAFSRRERGSWHLFVRDLVTGREHQLTRAACNAVMPVWDGAQLIYASDCGRGLGLTTLVRRPIGEILHH